MNYFGFIFMFMIPGIVIGGMAVGVINEIKRNRKTARAEERKRDFGRWFELKVD